MMAATSYVEDAPETIIISGAKHGLEGRSERVSRLKQSGMRVRDAGLQILKSLCETDAGRPGKGEGFRAKQELRSTQLWTMVSRHNSV